MNGIVGSNHMSVTQNGDVNLSIGISPIELRRYILYWDRIDWAELKGSNNDVITNGDLFIEGGSFGRIKCNNLKQEVIDKQVYKDIELLEQESLFKRYSVQVYPNNIEDDLECFVYGYPGYLLQAANYLCKNKLIEHLNKNESGFWRAGQCNGDFSFPDLLENEKKDVIEIDLYNCLPVPDSKANINDILEFKLKRNDELLLFRQAMDNLCNSVIDSPDVLREKQIAIENIQLSLSQIHRVMDESFLQKTVSTVKVLLDLNESPGLTALLTSLGTAGIITSNLALAGAGVAGITLNGLINILKKRVPKKETIPDRYKDYEYLYEVDKNFKRNKHSN
jgi:hypothetical protein